MGLRYFALQVKFSGNKWEQLGERHLRLRDAFDEMERLDLSYPTRIVRVITEVVLGEHRASNRNTKTAKSRVGKSKR